MEERPGEVKTYLESGHWWRKPWVEGLLVGFSILTVLILVFVARVAMEVRSIQKTDTTLAFVGLGEGSVTTSALLGQSATQPVAETAAVGAASIGNENAALTIVEFADFGCPFSREASFTMRELSAKYPERFRYVYRDFPILDLHPDAEHAALAARCAGEQGKFWAYHDRLYANQTALDSASLHRYASQVGLDVGAFSTCYGSGKFAKEIQDDFSAGVSAGVRGTPTFFLNGVKVEGALAPDKLEALLQKYADR